MDLNTIYKSKEDYYSLANDYFNKIDSDKLEINFLFKIVSTSISILVDHDFIPTPCVEIKLLFVQDEKEVGYYFLYVDENKVFVDEFLVIN